MGWSPPQMAQETGMVGALHPLANKPDGHTHYSLMMDFGGYY
jgi:hypothetical protein